MSILLDFLVTDAFARSRGAIDFPAHFIEGYAYLQSKFYGDRPGKFFGHDDAVLWMPQRLIKSGSVELNYLAARGKNGLYLAFMNQSRAPVSTQVTLNTALLPQLAGKVFGVRGLHGGDTSALRDGSLTLTVPPMGLVAVRVEELVVQPKFQDRLVDAKPADAWQIDYLELPTGKARAMILNFGSAATTAYVYLQADDAELKEAALSYSVGGRRDTITDASYPFEFTVPLGRNDSEFAFEVSALTVDGRRVTSERAALRR